MIVVDASAALSALFNDGRARRLLATEPLHTPHLVDAEVVNGLRRKRSAHEISQQQADTCLTTWRRLGVTRYPIVGLLDRVWELRDNLSAYDACYVALAEALACSLLTADGRLTRAAGPRCPITVVPR